MVDIAIVQDNEGQFDIAMDGPDLLQDNSLHTTVLICLFTDRQAEPDDVIPDGTDNHRGYWANPKMGSRLWLLNRAPATLTTALRAREYCIEALQILVDIGLASSVNVETEFQAEMLAIRIIITLADGSRYDNVFKQTLGVL